MSEAAKERVTAVPSKSKLLMYFRFGSGGFATHKLLTKHGNIILLEKRAALFCYVLGHAFEKITAATETYENLHHTLHGTTWPPHL